MARAAAWGEPTVVRHWGDGTYSLMAGDVLIATYYAAEDAFYAATITPEVALAMVREIRGAKEA
jgi:hypothetical protein